MMLVRVVIGFLGGMLALIPAAAISIPRPPQLRLHPSHISALPSYVERVAPAIVGIRVRAQAGAASSARLGAERFASGVVFDERGYVLTVSYALLDAITAEATTRDEGTVPAEVVGVDLETGLGLVKLPAGRAWRAATLASSADVAVGDVTGTVGVDEDNDLVHVVGTLTAVRRFAAFWEYMLDRALFVAPGSPSWGGSAVVDAQGRVVGVASLRLGEEPHINLAIPAEKFLAIKDELIAVGRVASRPPRPWLGLYTIAVDGACFVDGFATNGPARATGLRKGDRIVGVNGDRVGSQEEFYEALWRGQAGDVVHLTVQRAGRVHEIPVRSVERGALAGR
jgi:S1-C subfamily serine protease